MPFDLLALALDESVRRYDQDGRLRIAVSHLTKATINPYKGAEVPNAAQLGLDPNRVYLLFRDPAELEKAVDSFNHIPLLDQHIPVSAADAQQDHVVGSTGTHATWNDPYVDNSLVIWTESAIAAVESGAMKELSAAYRYTPDMTPGEYQGRRYDGVMRNIQANHVALVEAGRAGHDVMVMDSAPATDANRRSAKMTQLSPCAAFLWGSASAYLTPLLAKDQKMPDLRAAFAGVTKQNWPTKRDSVEAAVIRQVKPVLAQDAEIHIHEHLGNGEEVLPDDVLDPDAGGDLPGDPDGVAKSIATDDDLVATVQSLLEGKIDDNDLAMILHALQNLPKPGEEAPDVPPDEDNEATDQAEAITKGGDPLAKQPAMDRKVTMDAKQLKMAMDKVTDAAVKRAVAETKAQLNALHEAKRFVRPWVADITGAMDSADEVYKFALESLGLPTDVHPSAYRAILELAPRAGDTRAPRGGIAMDASGQKKYLERFPNANRLQQRH